MLQGMLSGRGKSMMFADADGATTFADLEKLEREMERINTADVSEVCSSGIKTYHYSPFCFSFSITWLLSVAPELIWKKRALHRLVSDPAPPFCPCTLTRVPLCVFQRSMFRTILMYGFHFLVWFLCVRGIRDTQCGFKLFTRDAARLLFHVMHVDRWSALSLSFQPSLESLHGVSYAFRAFDVDLLHIAEHYKLPIAEVPVRWQEIEGEISEVCLLI